MRVTGLRIIAGVLACGLAAIPQAARAAQAATTLGSLTVAAGADPSLDPAAPPTSWDPAAKVVLPWDVQDQRPASELTVAHVAFDGSNIYVRFDVDQREPLLAQQHTNDVGDGTDDEVWIDLWPNGNSGFYYQFAATSNGTHFQYSSENTAYAPTWISRGAVRPGGYTVTMKIPLAIMRGSGSGAAWKAQFVRIVRSTGERQIWSYDKGQSNGDDVTFAGSLKGIAPVAAVRPKPRLAIYGLGALGSPSSGLTTSRTGADFSVPVTATSSLFATLHPDFSNVEVDQQTISPTAFARAYNEVRPFFTQASNYLNPFDCDVCPNIRELYTPAIPTPRSGYAIEGKQGPASFTVFDAVGTGFSRNDGAAAVAVMTNDQHWRLASQYVDANIPSGPNQPHAITDHVLTNGISYNDRKHLDAYFNYGTDAGTNVGNASQAQRYDGGAYWYTNTFGIGGSMRKIGEFYNPVDGYVQHTDIAGYGQFENKIWLFNKNTILNSIQAGTFIDRYHNRAGLLNQSDTAGWIDVLTRNLIDIQWNFGSSYLRVDKDATFTPVTQSGVQLTWHSGSANNPGNNENHGSSATPTIFSYNTGRFGPGRVDSWTRSSTMRAGMRGTLLLEADDTRDYLDGGRLMTQWLERAGYTFAASSTSTLSIGWRRIIGTAPFFDPSNPPVSTNASNVSFAYHFRLPHDELFVAYGDASQLYTVPQFLIKFVHYFGAEKGT